MNLLNSAERPLVFRQEDTVSKVASIMFREGKYAVVIATKDGEYKGLVIANDLAKSKIDNPHKTHIKKFMTKIKPINSETPLPDLINSMIVNDYKAIPIKSGNEVLIITKMSILKALINEPILRNVKVKGIMRFPYCVSIDDTITTTMSVLRQLGVSRLPVVNNNDKIEGIVEALDLLKYDIEKSRMGEGEMRGERTKLSDASVSSVMKKNIHIVGPETSLNEAVEIMAESNIPTILVEEKDKITGIITPKAVLEFIKKQKFEGEAYINPAEGGVHVRIEGVQEEDPFIKSVIDKEVSNEVKKLAKIIPIDYMVLHIKIHEKGGERKKYSVKGRLITEKGFFFAQNYDWDITKAIRQTLASFEREIMKKRGKERVYRRGV